MRTKTLIKKVTRLGFKTHIIHIRGYKVLVIEHDDNVVAHVASNVVGEMSTSYSEFVWLFDDIQTMLLTWLITYAMTPLNERG